MPEIEGKTPLTVVVGPTASGKTALSVRLAEAAGGEVVSADSVQIYRHFDIGAGKPTLAERRGVPHHLIDATEPLEPMDAARWARLAGLAIRDVRERGRVPIVCGGTFLWVRALLFGLAPAPPGDESLRARHRAVAEAEGRAALYAELAAVDPTTSARLSPNDFVRVSRALEVYELTGRPLSEWHADHRFREPRYAARLIGIRHDPEDLSRRIAARAETMFEAGFVDEVRRLVSSGYREARGMRSVGYRQIADALESGEPDREALLREVISATRIFARRQRTWLREEPVEWLSPEDAEKARLGAQA